MWERFDFRLKKNRHRTKKKKFKYEKITNKTIIIILFKKNYHTIFANHPTYTHPW